ncbi:MAG: hypothetical protein U9Q75_00385 [Pseudomonadota bacterium]|nr:hypothetical protein [Pseudomonadota bacterium]
MKKITPSHLMISAFVFATATIPGAAFAAISGETKALFDTVKDVFKDGATLFLTLFGVVIFLAAAFWIFSSIAQWTKGKLDMGEMMIHIFVAIVGIMIALWMIDKAETKKDTIAYQHVIEAPAIAAQGDHWSQFRLSANRV